MSAPVDYFDSESLRKDLGGKTVRGGVVMALAQFASIGITLLAVPLLTRLLDTEDVGLFAIAAVFANFGAMFVDAGMSMATVQREDITRRHVNNLFWVAAGLGLLVATATAAAGPLVAMVYKDDRLMPLMAVLAVSFIASGLAIQHRALLRRGMQFQRLASIEIASQIVGNTAGITWAWRHFQKPDDYWALVVIPIVSAITRLGLSWLLCPWRPGLPRREAGTRSIIQFGANLTGFNFINYFARNTDKALLGWWCGDGPVGLYEIAYRISVMPTQRLTRSFTGVVTTALSRLVPTPDQYRQAYMKAARPMVWLSSLAIGGLIAVADPLVNVYLGEKFAEVGPLVLALAPGAWAWSVACLSAWVYASWGHVDRQLKWGLLNSLIVVSAAAAASPFGALATAYGIGFAYLTTRFIGFYICFLGTPIQMLDILGLLWRPSLACLVPAFATLVADSVWLQTPSDWLRLTGAVAIYAASAATACALLPGALKELIDLKHLLARRKSP